MVLVVFLSAFYFVDLGTRGNKIGVSNAIIDSCSGRPLSSTIVALSNVSRAIAYSDVKQFMIGGISTGTAVSM